MQPWQLRCPGQGDRTVTPPVQVPRDCVVRIELDATEPQRGLVVEVDAEREPEVVLIRERSDGRRLPPPVFTASAGARGVHLTSGPIASEHAKAMRLWIVNSDGTPLTVHGAAATEQREVPPHPVASIIELEHHNDLDIHAGEVAASLWLPLPATIGGQVPLDLRAWLEPADVGEIELVREGPVNLGLVVHFPPRATPVRVSVSWTAVVLVRDVLPEERATLAEPRATPEDWLASTAVIDASAIEARQFAAPILEAHPDDEARSVVLRDWLAARELVGEGPRSQQSTDVLISGSRANCTGSANLAAALGRALGIPTRHIGGIVTDDRLQTHSVVEMRLGAPPVWRRIEPQDGSVVGEDYMVVMRVVSPRDEAAAALDPRRIGAPGVPLRILIEAEKGVERLGYRDDTTWFPGCPRCDNAATRRATLQDVSLDALRRLQTRAQQSWQQRVDAAIRERNVARLDRSGDAAAKITTVDALTRYLDDEP